MSSGWNLWVWLECIGVVLSPSSEGDGVGAGEEKEALIGRILELQNTLHDLTQRVNSVREENCKLKSENEVRYVSGCFCTEIYRYPINYYYLSLLHLY